MLRLRSRNRWRLSCSRKFVKSTREATTNAEGAARIRLSGGGSNRVPVFRTCTCLPRYARTVWQLARKPRKRWMKLAGRMLQRVPTGPGGTSSSPFAAQRPPGRLFRRDVVRLLQMAVAVQTSRRESLRRREIHWPRVYSYLPTYR